MQHVEPSSAKPRRISPQIYIAMGFFSFNVGKGRIFQEIQQGSVFISIDINGC